MSEKANEKSILFKSLELINPRNLVYLSDSFLDLLRSKLWLKILVAMFLGVLTGFFLGPSMGWVNENTSETIGAWIALPGYFFLAVIQMIIIPLVFSSVVRGLASNENVEQLRKTGLWLVIYLLFTTSLAVTIGVLVGEVVQPGNYIDAEYKRQMQEDLKVSKIEKNASSMDADFDLKTIPENLVKILPTNPLRSMTNAEMLQVVIFAIAFGLALISMPKKNAEPMMEFLSSLEEICMTIVRWIMLIVPIAVFGLIAQATLKTGIEVLQSLGVYILTVLFAFVLLLIMYLVIVTVLGQRNPFKFLRQISNPMLVAFSTNSSAATMPVSIQTAEEELKVRSSTARFIIPIGATINMDASALYQGLATIFIAQLYGIDLSIGAQVAIVLTAVGASIGTPATPGVGIIILSSVLVSVGIPVEGLTLLIGIDRILELFRSSLNVAGDLVATVVMDRFLKTKISLQQA